MIIGMEFLGRNVRGIRSMEGIFEATRGTFRILGRNKATIGAALSQVHKLKPMDGRPPDPETETLCRSSIRAAQTIRVPPMTQVLSLVRSQLPGLFHMEPEHAVFVNHRVKLEHCIQEIGPCKPFIVVFANFSTCLENFRSIWFLATPHGSPRCSSRSTLLW